MKENVSNKILKETGSYGCDAYEQSERKQSYQSRLQVCREKRKSRVNESLRLLDAMVNRHLYLERQEEMALIDLRDEFARDCIKLSWQFRGSGLSARSGPYLYSARSFGSARSRYLGLVEKLILDSSMHGLSNNRLDLMKAVAEYTKERSALGYRLVRILHVGKCETIDPKTVLSSTYRRVEALEHRIDERMYEFNSRQRKRWRSLVVAWELPSGVIGDGKLLQPRNAGFRVVESLGGKGRGRLTKKFSTPIEKFKHKHLGVRNMEKATPYITDKLLRACCLTRYKGWIKPRQIELVKLINEWKSNQQDLEKIIFITQRFFEVDSEQRNTCN